MLVSLGVAIAGVVFAATTLGAWWIAGVAALFLALDGGEQLFCWARRPRVLRPCSIATGAYAGRQDKEFVLCSDGLCGTTPASCRCSCRHT